MLNNSVVLHDTLCTANNVFALNTKYVHPTFLDRDFFRIDPFVKPTDQRVISSQIFVGLNMQWLSLRPHARETNFTDA